MLPGQLIAGELTTKYLEGDEGGDRDEDTEARDFKTADAKDRRIHLSFRERVTAPTAFHHPKHTDNESHRRTKLLACWTALEGILGVTRVRDARCPLRVWRGAASQKPRCFGACRAGKLAYFGARTATRFSCDLLAALS